MLGSWDALLVSQLCECMRVQYFLKWDDNDTLSYGKICAIRLLCQELVALAKHRGVKANGKKASTDLALGDSVLVGPGDETPTKFEVRQKWRNPAESDAIMPWCWKSLFRQRSWDAFRSLSAKRQKKLQQDRHCKSVRLGVERCCDTIVIIKILFLLMIHYLCMKISSRY